MHRRPPAPVLLAAVAAALAATYRRVLFGGETFVLRDTLRFTLPSREFLASALRAGRIPEWWDAVALGVPFAANPIHGLFHPFAWLVAIAPMPLAADLVPLACLAAAGLGAALFARRLGAGAGGAALAGVVFSICGYTASVLQNGLAPILTWSSWVAWAADCVARPGDGRRARLRAGAALAAALALQICAGEPAAIVDAILLAAAVGLSRAERKAHAAGTLAAAGAASLLLAAAALLPGLALLGASERAAGLGLAESTAWSLPPLRLLELGWPRFLGNPIELSNLAWVLTVPPGGTGGLEPHWSLSLHLGVPAIAFAAAAAARPDLRRLLWASLVFVVLATGSHTPLYAAFRAVFPPERLARYPEKHIIGALVLWCGLAGAGFTRLYAARPSRRAVAAALAGAGILAAAVAVTVLARPALEGALRERAAARGLPIDVGGALDVSLSAGAAAASVAALAALSLLLAGRPRLGRLAPVLAGMAAAGHLAYEARALTPLAPRAAVALAPAVLPPPPSRALPGEGLLRTRLFRGPNLTLPAALSSDEDWVRFFHETAVDNTAARFGFDVLPGAEGVASASLRRFWREVYPSLPFPAFVRLFGIELLLLQDEQAAGAGLPRLAHIAAAPEIGWSLLAGPPGRPRAFVAPRWSRAPPGEALAALAAPGRDRDLARVVLEGPGESSPPGERDLAPLAPCEARSTRPEQVEIACASPLGGFAVLLDEASPGWSAEVDGAPAPIERADGLFRAVAIGPGVHRVAFTYRTPGLRTGLAISAGAWLAWLAVVLLGRPRNGAIPTGGSKP